MKRTKQTAKKKKFLSLSLRSGLSMTLVVAMMLWVDGSALANQFSSITTAANTLVSAVLTPTSLFTTMVSQMSSGPVNQTAGYTGSAATIATVGGMLDASNTAAINQTEVAVGSTNQDGSIDGTALSDVGLDVAADATVTADVTQDATSPANQDVAGTSDGATEVTSDLAVDTTNDLVIQQVADTGLINQDGSVLANGTSDVLQEISGASTGMATVEQTSTGGPANQDITNITIIDTLIQAVQNVLTFNTVNIDQDCIGTCNQNAMVDVSALANVGQILDGSSVAVNDLSQENVGGSVNQNAGNTSTANSLLEALQDILTGNDVTVTQMGDGGPANQDMSLTGVADTDIGQLVSSSATTSDSAVQTNVGGSGNQDLTNAGTAVDAILAAQTGGSANTVVGSQTNDDGSANQNMLADFTAETDGLQLVDGTALAASALTQSVIGGAGNQTAGNELLASDAILAGQELASANSLDLSQENDDGDANQLSDVTVDADVDGAQIVFGPAIAVTTAAQSVAGGAANQDYANSGVASDVIVAAQSLGSFNEVELDQENGDGDANMAASLVSNADIDGLQLVTGTALASTGIAQLASGGSANQDLANTSVASDVIVAGQELLAGNALDVDQENDDGNANMAVDATVGADAEAAQIVLGSALSLNSLGQTAVGGSANQDLTNNSVAADTIVAGQTGLVGNEVDVDQDNDDGDANMGVSLLADADSDSLQFITGPAISTTVASQLVVGGDGNQTLDNDSVASDTIVAGQAGAAVNDIEVDQENDDGDANMAADVSAGADSDGLQTILGTVISSNELGQTVVGGDANQDLSNDATAAQVIVAGQERLAANEVDVDQENDDGDANMAADVAVDADVDAGQVIIGNAFSTNGLTQTAVGGSANQGLTNDATASDVILAGQELAAGNEVDVDQENDDGDANFGSSIAADADTDGLQFITGPAIASTNVDQLAVGGAANQDVANTSAASDVIAGSQELASTNDIEVDQENDDGNANMDLGVGAVADADGAQVLAGIGATTNELSQTALGGSANQGMTNDTAASDVIAAGQSVVSVNEIDGDQENDDGNANFDGSILADADADGLQVSSSVASSLNDLNQTAVGGDANQDIDHQSAVAAVTALGQTVVSVNDAELDQENDDGSANMDAAMDLEADATGTQVATTVAADDVDIDQVASGGDANQSVTSNTPSTAVTAGGQDVVSVNGADIDQDNDDGAANLTVGLAMDADADGTQLLSAVALDTVEVDQVATGGSANQDVATNSASTGVSTGDQSVVSVNGAEVDQSNDDGNANILANLDFDAMATGDQSVTGVGVGDASVAQTNSGGSGNQSADNDGVAVGVGAGTQEIVAVNAADLDQDIDTSVGAGSQAANLTGSANANGDQTVVGLGSNTQDLDQTNTGGSANQTGANDGTAVGVAAGDQEVVAVNDYDVDQDIDLTAGAGAQSLTIDGTANATGVQTVIADAGNTQTLDQTNTGGSANQDGSNTGVAAATADAGSSQTIAAVNDVDVDQDLDATSAAGAQAAMITPTADATGTQTVTAGSSNDQSVTQGNDDGAANQMASNDGTSETIAEADQDISAVNNVELVQTADATNAAVAQAAHIAPSATANGTQDLDATSGNTQGVNQAVDDGSGNQDGSNTGVASTDATAEQDVAAETNTLVMQDCDVSFGACAQFVDYDGSATNNSAQQMTAGSTNDQTVNQAVEDGSGNQNASNNGTADTIANADQDTAATTDTEVIQTCTLTGGACAQYFGGTMTSTNDSSQVIDASSGNTSEINQDLDDDAVGNQDAESDLSAVTDVSAAQNTLSETNTTVTQTSGAGGNQAATVNGSSNTTSTMTLTGGSSNTTVINQNQ